MYYRYDLLVDGEPQGVGAIQGLEDTAIPEEEQRALVAELDELMAIPTVFSQGRTASYFTEAGLAAFGGVMEKIAEAFDDDGLFEVRMESVDSFPPESIAYEDEYQVVVFV